MRAWTARLTSTIEAVGLCYFFLEENEVNRVLLQLSTALPSEEAKFGASIWIRTRKVG
jgi:hypothetical protein